MVPFGSRLPGKTECVACVWMGQAHMKNLRPQNAPQRFSLAWTGERSVWGWRHWTDHHNKLSTCHLIMVIIVSQSGNTPDYRDNLSGESQEDWGTSCKVLPTSTQSGLGRAQWASLSWCWHYPPFLRASLCRASQIETFSLAPWLPQASIPSEISQEETWTHLTSLHWASFNLLALGQELCTRKGKLRLCVHVDPFWREQSSRTI